MTAKPNDKNVTPTSKPDELTDDQLNDASGGIIFVGGEPVVSQNTSFSSGGGGGSGKIAVGPLLKTPGT
jgi:hypothetical protein